MNSGELNEIKMVILSAKLQMKSKTRRIVSMIYDCSRYKYQHSMDRRDAEMELDEKATFDPEVFFNVLLPPIIFHAGYSMKRVRPGLLKM